MCVYQQVNQNMFRSRHAKWAIKNHTTFHFCLFIFCLTIIDQVTKNTDTLRIQFILTAHVNCLHLIFFMFGSRIIRLQIDSANDRKKNNFRSTEYKLISERFEKKRYCHK